jgi:ATP-dependent DNA helicase RecG
VISELINAGESKTVELEEDFSQKNQISKTVCAFANRAGGHIIIGVNDQKEVLGIDDELVDDYLDRVSNVIHYSIYPMIIPEIYTYRINNKSIIVIQIYPGNTPPYYLKNKGKNKGTYIRVGKTNKVADYEIIKELERQKMNKTFDEDIFTEVNYEDVGNLTYILKDILGKEITEEKLKNLKLIIKAGDIKYFSNAAMIVLGKMDNCSIKCARFMGDSVLNFIDKKEYSGDIFSVLNSTVAFLKSHINMTGIISGSGLKRRDILEIPVEVLREAILNAIVHRDYAISGSDIKVAVYNSRIEVISPGGLPKSITIEEIYAGRSEIRNKIIARIFKEAGIMEQWGSGIPRIREAYRQEGLKPPELSEDGLFVKLTIFRKTNEQIINENRSQYFLNINLPKSIEVKKEKEQVYDLIDKNGNYTVKEISKLIGISQSAVQRRLDALQKEKIIKRIGSKKSGRWKTNRRK